MASQYKLGGWYPNPETGKNQRWWNGTWTNGEDPTGGNPNYNQPAPQPTPQAIPAQSNPFNAASVTTQASATPQQGSEQALIDAMVAKGHTPETAKANIAGRGYEAAAREYLGTGGAGVPGMTNQPTINLPQIYQGLVESSGIKAKQEELSKKAQQLAEAKAKISDNPFLSEATRVGRIAKLDSLYNDQVAGLQNDISTKQADIETKLNLQTKQFDINSQQAQQSLSQFNALLSAGALDNASSTDIAQITLSTGLSSDMIQNAVNAHKVSGYQTTTQTFDDGTNEGFIVYTLDPSGNVINEVKKVTGKSSKAGTFDINTWLKNWTNQNITNGGQGASTTPEDISNGWKFVG